MYWLLSYLVYYLINIHKHGFFCSYLNKSRNLNNLFDHFFNLVNLRHFMLHTHNLLLSYWNLNELLLNCVCSNRFFSYYLNLLDLLCYVRDLFLYFLNFLLNDWFFFYFSDFLDSWHFFDNLNIFFHLLSHLFNLLDLFFNNHNLLNNLFARYRNLERNDHGLFNFNNFLDFNFIRDNLVNTQLFGHLDLSLNNLFL